MKSLFKFNKDNIMKLVSILAVAAVICLAVSIFTTGDDSRKQINTQSSTEEKLCNILSDIKGVGQVDALIEYDDSSEVTGVIVTASGASDPIVRKKIVEGVSTLFNISTSDVVVYEKKQEVI